MMVSSSVQQYSYLHWYTGKNTVTALPDLANSVVIPAGASYSFYVTVANATLGTLLNFQSGSGMGNVSAFDENIEIYNGYSMLYPYLSYSTNLGKGWKWNGTNLIFSALFSLLIYSHDSIIIPLSRQCALLHRGLAFITNNE